MELLPDAFTAKKGICLVEEKSTEILYEFWLLHVDILTIFCASTLANVKLRYCLGRNTISFICLLAGI